MDNNLKRNYPDCNKNITKSNINKTIRKDFGEK